jgi:hypothetical protein
MQPWHGVEAMMENSSAKKNIMGLEDVKKFFSKHPNLKEEKPGLHKFLEEADWREKYEVSEDEAEYLVKIDIIGERIKTNPLIWAHELMRYRITIKRE